MRLRLRMHSLYAYVYGMRMHSAPVYAYVYGMCLDSICMVCIVCVCVHSRGIIHVWCTRVCGVRMHPQCNVCGYAYAFVYGLYSANFSVKVVCVVYGVCRVRVKVRVVRVSVGLGLVWVKVIVGLGLGLW